MCTKQIRSLIAFFCIFLNACSLNTKQARSGEHEVLVNPQHTYQTIEGFGASDCWTMQFVGKNWPESKKNTIADLLFSHEVDAYGNPKGIALSQWRFNIGGGTAEQGESSEIPNPWRRAECFLNADGSYNWNKQLGQQWFLRAAKQRGVHSLLAFNNTPPVHFTKNGKGWSPGGDQYNLKPDKYDDYANFLVEVCSFFNKQGLAFDYISPFNEPQWDWKAPASQEGTPAWNNEIALLVNELSPLLAKQLPNLQIAIPEAAQLQFLYEKRGYQNRDNQLNDLFSSTSDISICHLSNIKKAAMGHSYFTTNNLDTLIEVRQKLKNYLNQHYTDLAYWQSEFCILEEHQDLGGGGNKRDLGMPTALYVARVIHADLSIADATLWSWWTSVSPVDYKDGLVYIDLGADNKSDKDKGDLRQDGFIRDSKILWVLGNYSRFIDPGMMRIETQLSNPTSLKEQLTHQMVSGYKASDNSKFVFVVVNYEDKNTSLSFSQFLRERTDLQVTCYVTSKDKNLQRTKVEGDFIDVPARSVVTVVME